MIKNVILNLGMVVHAFNSNTLKAKASRSLGIQRQPVLQREFLVQPGLQTLSMDGWTDGWMTYIQTDR